jgi:2-methylcitrate dehydratase
VLSHSGSDFAVMGMHFKLGLYEHQSAGAIEGIKRIMYENPALLNDASNIKQLEITSYEPAFGIIGDPAKKDPTTRQSADHSMVYIISRLLKKAFDIGPDAFPRGEFDTWKTLMLDPHDYGYDALYDPTTRQFMEKFKFVHGGDKYDSDYPEGIPTSLTVHTHSGESYESGYVMFPPGHARNTTMDLEAILAAKNQMLGDLAVEDVGKCVGALDSIADASAADMMEIYNHPFKTSDSPIDGAGSCPAHWEAMSSRMDKPKY